MQPFRDIPIKRKLIIITMLTSVVALFLACVTFLIYEQISFRRSLARDFSVLAEMVQENLAPGLAFDDLGSMETTLQSLSAHQHIMAAGVFDGDGQLVSAYQNPELETQVAWPQPEGEGSRFHHDRLEVFQNVTLAGEKIGTLYLASDLRVVNERLLRYALVMGLIMLLACLAAYVLAVRLQRVISGPISHLADIAGRVAIERNVALRANKRGNDELGTLIDRFNEMLEQVQKQDAALLQAKDQLELRVEERTLALRQEIAERRRTEQERDGFFRVTLDMLCVAGFDGGFHRVNPAFSATLGFSKNELMAMSFVDIVYPEDRAKTLAEIKNLAQGKPSLDFEIRCTCKDGDYRWIVWTLAPVLQTGLMYACGRDVTERKHAQIELAEAHTKLMDFSRQAGMAEVATSVLHNVGNVLNSVSVSAEIVAGKVRQFRIGSLQQVSALLHEHAGNLPDFLANDRRGKELPAYLLRLIDHLNEPQRDIYNELDSLRGNIEHIKEIVTMQQSYARGAAIIEPLSVPELIEDAIRMNGAAFTRHDLTVKRDFGQLPQVVTDRHKVLQILVNLLNNAKQAVDAEGCDRHLTVRAKANDRTAVKIEVIDSGTGIAPENLTRIFQHGFTTKRHGHGFGLHSGALAAKELGGSLTAFSEGLGKGSVFTLTLPIHTNGS